jgi:hypothetical protein
MSVLPLVVGGRYLVEDQYRMTKEYEVLDVSNLYYKVRIERGDPHWLPKEHFIDGRKFSLDNPRYVMEHLNPDFQ